MARAADRHHRILERIIVTLLALSALAERVYAAPGPVRQLVMWALRPAEAVVRDFVVDAGPPALLAPVNTGLNGHSPDDALRLAASLRALAAVLSLMQAQFALHALRCTTLPRLSVNQLLCCAPIVGLSAALAAIGNIPAVIDTS